MVLCWIRSRLIWMVWLATPCARWSVAKGGSQRTPSGLALACAVATCAVVECCAASSVRYCIENPWSSGLWSWKRLRRLLDAHHVAWLHWDQCCFDAGWKKPTCIATTAPGGVDFLCPGHRQHVRLQGTVTVGTAALWRTSFASAYPAALCRHVAAWFWSIKPLDAEAPSSEAGPDIWWRSSLEATCPAGAADAKFVELAELPPKPCLGWEGAARQRVGFEVGVEWAILRQICRRNQSAKSCP